MYLSLLCGGIEAFATRPNVNVARYLSSSQFTTTAASALTGSSTFNGNQKKNEHHNNVKSFVLDSKLRGGSAASFTSTTKLNMSKDGDDDKEAPFTTWTFDKACQTMEINSISPATISCTTDVDAAMADDADLLILGIVAPPKEDDDDDEDAKKADDEEGETPEPVLVGKTKELDEELNGAIKDILMEQYKDFKHGASAGATTSTLRLASSSTKAKRIILLGLGPESKPDDDEKKKDAKNELYAKIGATLATKCNSEKKVSKCTLLLPNNPTTLNLTDTNKDLSDLSRDFYTTLYSDNRYRTGDKVKVNAKELTSITIASEDSSMTNVDYVNDAMTTGSNIATGISLSKDIVNAPHNVLNSESLANVARQIAEESDGLITCEVLGKEECEKRGMGAYLGVARGSETDPQFIHLTYSPKSGKASKKVGIVGKGLLFDTGGYNIKTAMMELMKFDCGGAAAVLGAARAVGKLAPEDVEAHFIVAACENMINDRAVVPSDVLTASNGMTIEIINTDAEGRLTLADALVFADKELGCESIIELSTLTGACMVSLGQKVCGVWTGDDDLAEELKSASELTGDKSWRMPLVKEYNDQLKSKIADITNCGTRYGGAITAALFLENFVSKKKPFAHIDIAGPVWSDKIGATGFGAKMVTEWVSKQGKKE